jgi:hypothetical protein
MINIIKLLFICIFFLLSQIAVAQKNNFATLIFYYPFSPINSGYDTKLKINNIQACTLNSNQFGKIASCQYKVAPGEVNIESSTIQEDLYSYSIDVEENRTYSLVVYFSSGFDQSWDLLWSTLSANLITNKLKEPVETTRYTPKIKVIAIKQF